MVIFWDSGVSRGLIWWYSAKQVVLGGYWMVLGGLGVALARNSHGLVEFSKNDRKILVYKLFLSFSF